MNISEIHPNFNVATPEAGIQELLRSILIRTNLIPGIRYRIGWRGLKDSSHGMEAWTARIDGLPGIFGISFERNDLKNDLQTGRFALYYFPSPEEELIERLSVKAGIQAQQQDYLEKVRDFLRHPEFQGMFFIGSVRLMVKSGGKQLMLELESMTRQIVISKNGITLPAGDEGVELVPPDGIDQDFPAFDTAYRFFRVLAASLTFNLGEPPVFLDCYQSPGPEYVSDAATGLCHQVESSRAEMRSVCLGFGLVEAKRDPTNTKENKGKFRLLNSLSEGETVPKEYVDELWWEAHRIGNFSAESGELSGIDNRPQLILVTGFLGSGKTSFLQHFIEYQGQMNRFTAVIQNEIGEVGLDAKLLDQGYAVTEMDEGCVCCTLVGNLKAAVNGILKEYRPDFIILETTGLANPFNLLDELDELKEILRFDSVTTLVDGLNIEESLDRYNTAVNQVKASDLIILNKVDLLDSESIKRITRILRHLNPGAPIINSSYGDVNPALLFDPGLTNRSTCQGEGPNNTKASDCGCHNHYHNSEDHHHHSHMSDDLSALKIDFSNAVDKDRLIGALSEIPQSVYRIKGVIDLQQYDYPMLVQFVGGRYEISRYPDADFNERYLIVIGQDLTDSFSGKSFKSSLEVV